MANEDLNIKLVMDVVNNMSGKLDQAASDLNRVTQAMDLAQKKAQTAQVGMKGSLFNPNTWSVLLKDSELLERRMNQLRSSGLEKMALGATLLAPVVATVKAAGDLEQVMNQIKIDVYDSNDSTEEWARKVQLLRDTTIGISRDVKYGAAGIAEAVDELARGNVEVEDIANGAAKAAVFLAQASKDQISPAGSAEAVAKLGNAWQLTGKELEGAADTLARVDAASVASIPSLLEGFKYVSSSASNLNISIRETAIALGILNNAGLDGSTAGTTLNQMLQHLQPRTEAAREMFESLGLSVENNPFFDADGRMKPLIEVINILRNATRDLTDQQKQMAFKSVFDERGSRAVINLLKEGKNSYEEIEGSLDRQMSLWDRIKTQNEGLNMSVEILKGNITTLFAESGSPLGQELTSTVKQANEFVVALTEWTRLNPEVTSGVLSMTLAVGGLTTAVGAAQVAIATLIKVWAPLAPILGPAGVVAGTTAALYKLGEKVGPYIWGTASYQERKLREQQELYDNRAELANIPATLSAAPPGMFDPPWYERWLESMTGGRQEPARAPLAPQGPEQTLRYLEEWARKGGRDGPITININARDAQEAAQEVKRVIDRPASVRYQQSRMPLPHESFITQE